MQDVETELSYLGGFQISYILLDLYFTVFKLSPSTKEKKNAMLLLRSRREGGNLVLIEICLVLCGRSVEHSTPHADGARLYFTGLSYRI